MTLYMSICGGVDWNDAGEPLMTIHESMGFLFAVYIAFAVFCVLNIVTGVFVENANKITTQGDESVIVDELVNRRQAEEVQRLFLEMDSNGDGELAWDEFK